MLDIKVVVRRSVQYLLAPRALQLATALPFFVLTCIAVANRHLTVSELATETVAYLFWIVLAGLTLRFRHGIQSWLDRRFFREQYDREQLLVKLLESSRRVESLGELGELVNDTLADALHPVNTGIWYRDPRELSDTAASNAAAAGFPSDERWLSWLERQAAATPLPVPEGAGLSQEDALVRRTRRAVESRSCSASGRS